MAESGTETNTVKSWGHVPYCFFKNVFKPNCLLISFLEFRKGKHHMSIENKMKQLPSAYFLPGTVRVNGGLQGKIRVYWLTKIK